MLSPSTYAEPRFAAISPKGFTHGGSQDMTFTAQSSFLPSYAKCIGVARTSLPTHMTSFTNDRAVDSSSIISRSRPRVSTSTPRSRQPCRFSTFRCTTWPLDDASPRSSVFTSAHSSRCCRRLLTKCPVRKRTMCCTYSACDTGRGRSSYMSAMPMGYASGKHLAKRPGCRGCVGSPPLLGQPNARWCAARVASVSALSWPTSSSSSPTGSVAAARSPTTPNSSASSSTNSSSVSTPAPRSSSGRRSRSHAANAATVTRPSAGFAPSARSSWIRMYSPVADSSSKVFTLATSPSKPAGKVSHHRCTRQPSRRALSDIHSRNISSSTTSTSSSPSAAPSPPSSGAGPNSRTSSPASTMSSAYLRFRNCPSASRGAYSAFTCASVRTSKRRGSYHLCMGPSSRPSLSTSAGPRAPSRRQAPTVVSARRMDETRPQRTSRPSRMRPCPRFRRRKIVSTPFRNLGCHGIRTRGETCSLRSTPSPPPS